MLGLKPDDNGVYLKALAPLPTCFDYQIWVAHQKNSEKDVHTGTNSTNGHDQWCLRNQRHICCLQKHMQLS